MGEELIEMLRQRDLIKGAKANASTISRLTVRSFTNLLDEWHQAVAEKRPYPQTGFTYCASNSLGAGPWPCSKLACRLRRARHLAQFAALYSDRVYINDFLGDSVFRPSSKSNWEIARQELRHDVTILAHLAPLIEAGIIVPVGTHYCKTCLCKHALGVTTPSTLDTMLRHFSGRYEREVRFTVALRGGRLDVHLDGPEDLMSSCCAGFFVSGVPEELSAMPRVMARMQSGEPVALSRTAAKRIGWSKMVAQSTAYSVLFHRAAASSLGAQLLSDEPIEIELIKEVWQDGDQARRSRIMERHLRCVLPFLEGIRPRELAHLRKQEEAFVLFRQGLQKAIDVCKVRDVGTSESEARALYEDFVAPTLARLDVTMQSARRALVRGTTRNILAWTAAICFGMCSGVLPSQAVAAAAAVGLTHIVADVLDGLMNKSDLEETIRGDQMYFLWKVREASNRAK